MNRRAFLQGVTAASLAAWLPIPKWIGAPAGGFYTPLPDPFDHLITWSDWLQPVNADTEVKCASLAAVWAPPGASLGQIQMIGGTVVQKRRERDAHLVAAKIENLYHDFRRVVDQMHEPGWFKVSEPRYDANGHWLSTENVWRRVGYVAWVNVSQLNGPTIMVPA